MAERIIPIRLEEDEQSDKEEKKCNEAIKYSKVSKGIIQDDAASHLHLPEKSIEIPESILGEYSLPNACTRERIVIVIDRAQDKPFTPFFVKSTQVTPLSIVKRAVQIFIKLKTMINKEHEIAIVALDENKANLLQDFTRDLRKLKDVVNKITECEVEDIFNLNSLFEILSEMIRVPQVTDSKLPPPFISRCIIFYGRSYTIPHINRTENISALLDYPYFTCDILMTHEPVESSNNCGKIFEVLENLDKKGTAYFFSVCRNSKLLYNSTSRLLAHPLQRSCLKAVKN